MCFYKSHWRLMSFSERGKSIVRAADLLGQWTRGSDRNKSSSLNTSACGLGTTGPPLSLFFSGPNLSLFTQTTILIHLASGPLCREA